MMRTMQKLAAAIAVIVAAVALGAPPTGADQTILGSKVYIKQKQGIPESRQVIMKAKEKPSTSTLGGDPLTNGASLAVIAQGGTPSTQTYNLPGGAEFWKRKPADPLAPTVGWQYKDKNGLNSAVTKFWIKIQDNTKASLQVGISGKSGQPVDIVPPNPGTYVGLVFTINGAGGDTYCVNLGGAAGGSFNQGGASKFKIKKPVAEATCPDPNATCGDNVASPPNETCDGTDNVACPGLCGSNGLPCLCPFCGDGVKDPNEACDQNDLGACTDGCSYACTCTTCGNNVAEYPAEDCDGTDDSSCPGLCLPPGNVNQCQCPICGDDSVNQASEECDGTDDGACTTFCLGNCTCAL